MFLRGSLDLAPVSLLATPQLETPFSYPENHRNIFPSWLSRARTATRYYRRGFLDCLRQPRPRTETRPTFSVKGKPSPARTRLHVRGKPNATGGASFYWTPPPRAMSTKTRKRKPGQVFRKGETLPSTRIISHASQN